MRGYSRCGLSYRDVEEFPADRGIEVDDVYVCKHGEIAWAMRIFTTSLTAHHVPAAFHNTGQYENNRWECDHGR